MDVNSISNNISTLNTSSSLNLDKVNSSKSVSKISEDSTNLYINEYNKKRDELSSNVQSLNVGIAVTEIAKSSIDKQQSYLKNIQTKLDNANSYENKNDIKQSINEDLRNFNQVAYETKFKRENVIASNYYDDKATIDVNTKNANFSIEKPNTPTYANDIFELSNSSDLNDPEALKNLASKIQTSSNQLQNTYDNFTQFGNKLEDNARETIKEQVNLYNENKTNKDRNFGNDSTDFSKTNINANMGYLAASQANIVQAQSVRLLS
jgi:flagellin